MRKIKKSLLISISLVLFFFISPFIAIRDLWYVLVLKNSPTIGVNFVQTVYATVLASVEEALEIFYPGAQIEEEFHSLTDEQKIILAEKGRIIPEDLDRDFNFYVASNAGKIIGYVAEDAVPGKWGLIHYMMSISLEGKVLSVMVLDYSEKRGKPIAKRRFLKQFKGKSVKSKIRLNKDIRGITGASISSRGMTKGVRKMVHVFSEIYIQ